MVVGVENNHTDSPRVNPGRFKVAIKGTPTFPVRGIVQGVPSMGISWLVFKGVLSIASNKETKYEVNSKLKITKHTPKGTLSTDKPHNTH